jgi:hypothetical protein
VVLTLDQQFGVQKAGVDDMGPGQHTPLLQGSVDLAGRRTIGRRTTHRFDIGDEVWQIILAGFCAMDFIADPRRGVLTGIMGLEVIGGAEELRRQGGASG